MSPEAVSCTNRCLRRGAVLGNGMESSRAPPWYLFAETAGTISPAPPLQGTLMSDVSWFPVVSR